MRCVKTALVLGCALGLVDSAAAVKWLTHESYRVAAMGSANLAIDDESTALTLLNHENPAGLVLNSRMNRLDLGLTYRSDLLDVSGSYKTAQTDLELTRPGTENRGLTYWLNDNLVGCVGLESLIVSQVTTPAGVRDQNFNYADLGGGASAAYRTDFGLVFGAGIFYTGAGGKPDPLPLDTLKQDISAANLNWGVGLAYVLEHLGDNHRLSLGVQAGADDERPVISSGSNNFGDFSSVVETVLSVPGIGTLANRQWITNTPIKISGEAIFDLDEMLSVGLLVDHKTRETRNKIEQIDSAGGVLGGTYTTEYKAAALNLLGISPVVRAHLPLGEGVTLLPGILFTTYGSGTSDTYSSDSLNSSYRQYANEFSASMFSAGLGLQSMGRQLQLAVQFGSGLLAGKTRRYDPGGNLLDNQTAPDDTITLISGGAEFWLLPVLALRAGYLTSTETVKYSDGDQKRNTGTLSFGAGLSLPNGLNSDLLVKLDTYTQDPAPSPKHSATGMFLGARLPL